ncbi:hypothetical protein SAMN05443144_10218 [Fodinibius roseus]|uniref:Uncharacterized protein n=1 Tax=Fodinibius roseus TaxID=1194090 RepID=A0A1M4UF34_9BACT|nr:hypothetical protein SAMN05443144_10218 [Fodinibius roseus]
MPKRIAVISDIHRNNLALQAAKQAENNGRSDWAYWIRKGKCSMLTI